MLTVATSVIGKTAVKTAAKKFSGAVIERWTRYRAERFFEGFVEVLANEFTSGDQTDEVDKRLSLILADDRKSEVLFDAYRRVCFTKSKTLGPRIIGLLTGELVHEGRMADSTEEKVFDAAELLSDPELIAFMKDYQEQRKDAESAQGPKAKHRMSGESIIVEWLRQSSDTSGHGEHEIGSFPWEDALGRWAAGLHQCGLIEDRIQQKIHRLDYRHDEAEGETRTITTTTIIFDPGCARLYNLLYRSVGPESAE